MAVVDETVVVDVMETVVVVRVVVAVLVKVVVVVVLCVVVVVVVDSVTVRLVVVTVDTVVDAPVVVVVHWLNSLAASRVPLKFEKAVSFMVSPAGEEHAIATTEPTFPAELKTYKSIFVSAGYSPVMVSFPSNL